MKNNKVRIAALGTLWLAWFAFGCVSEPSNETSDLNDWAPDDAEIQEGELLLASENLESTPEPCLDPDVPEIAVMSPNANDSFARGDFLKILAEIKTCRRVKSVYAEVTEPSLSSDKKLRVHKYGLLRQKEEPLLREKTVKVPKKARLGTHQFRIVVVSLRLEEREVRGKVQRVWVREETATTSIGLEITDGSTGGEPACHPPTHEPLPNPPIREKVTLDQHVYSITEPVTAHVSLTNIARRELVISKRPWDALIEMGSQFLLYEYKPGTDEIVDIRAPVFLGPTLEPPSPMTYELCGEAKQLGGVMRLPAGTSKWDLNLHQFFNLPPGDYAIKFSHDFNVYARVLTKAVGSEFAALDEHEGFFYIESPLTRFRVIDAPATSCDSSVYACDQALRAFVTSTTHRATEFSREDADSICQTRAQSAGLGGQWLAWLGTRSSLPRERFGSSTKPYVRLDGQLLAADLSDFADLETPLLSPLNLDETGALATGFAWTGEAANRPVVTYSFFLEYDEAMKDVTCFDWAKLDYFDSSVGDVNGRWHNSRAAKALSCGDAAHLYCVEQP